MLFIVFNLGEAITFKLLIFELFYLMTLQINPTPIMLIYK